MSTVSLSLPSDQLKKIDELSSRFGFANRSEFVRSLLRFVLHNPDVLNETVSFPFITPSEKSRKKILSEFQKTGKYSSEFLKDLEIGLKHSDFFID